MTLELEMRPKVELELEKAMAKAYNALQVKTLLQNLNSESSSVYTFQDFITPYAPQVRVDKAAMDQDLKYIRLNALQDLEGRLEKALSTEDYFHQIKELHSILHPLASGQDSEAIEKFCGPRGKGEEVGSGTIDKNSQFMGKCQELLAKLEGVAEPLYIKQQLCDKNSEEASALKSTLDGALVFIEKALGRALEVGNDEKQYILSSYVEKIKLLDFSAMPCATEEGQLLGRVVADSSDE
ncbi:MAG: hypothetical protein V4485_05345 [Pseudomonadota bacterium]